MLPQLAALKTADGARKAAAASAKWLLVLAIAVGLFVSGYFMGAASVRVKVAKGETKVAQQKLEQQRKTIDEVLTDVDQQNKTDLARERFLDDATRQVEDFYAARGAQRAQQPATAPKEHSHAPIAEVAPCDCDTVFDADELRLFNLGNAPGPDADRP